MMTKCPKCGAETGWGAISCPVCNFILPEKSSAYQRDSLEWGTTNPWEDIPRFGIAKAFGKTAFLCLRTPSVLFKSLMRSRDTYSAWLFALIAGSIGILCSFFWTKFFSSSMMDAMQALGIDLEQKSTATLALISAPLLVSINIIALSVYCHGLFVLLGMKKKPFSSTFRALCYAEAASLWTIIPAIGNIISFFYSLYLVVAGIAYTHSLGRVRVLIVLLAPLFALVMMLSLIIAAFIIGGFSSSGFLKDIFEILR